jgi:hypothetical protein
MYGKVTQDRNDKLRNDVAGGYRPKSYQLPAGKLAWNYLAAEEGGGSQLQYKARNSLNNHVVARLDKQTNFVLLRAENCDFSLTSSRVETGLFKKHCTHTRVRSSTLC